MPRELGIFAIVLLPTLVPAPIRGRRCKSDETKRSRSTEPAGIARDCFAALAKTRDQPKAERRLIWLRGAAWRRRKQKVRFLIFCGWTSRLARTRRTSRKPGTGTAGRPRASR